MKHFVAVLSVMAMLGALAPMPAAHAAYYLKIDDIPGESVDATSGSQRASLRAQRRLMRQGRTTDSTNAPRSHYRLGLSLDSVGGSKQATVRRAHTNVLKRPGRTSRSRMLMRLRNAGVMRDYNTPTTAGEDMFVHVKGRNTSSRSSAAKPQSNNNLKNLSGFTRSTRRTVRKRPGRTTFGDTGANAAGSTSTYWRGIFNTND